MTRRRFVLFLLPIAIAVGIFYVLTQTRPEPYVVPLEELLHVVAQPKTEHEQVVDGVREMPDRIHRLAQQVAHGRVGVRHPSVPRRLPIPGRTRE